MIIHQYLFYLFKDFMNAINSNFGGSTSLNEIAARRSDSGEDSAETTLRGAASSAEDQLVQMSEKPQPVHLNKDISRKYVYP